MDPKHSGGIALLMAMGKPKHGMSPHDDEEEEGPEDGMMSPDEHMEDEQEHGENPYDIPAPEGFQPPDGVEAGQSFEMTIKAHMTEDNEICIDEIGGVPTDAEGHEEAEDQNEDEEQEDGSQDMEQGPEVPEEGEERGEPMAQGGPPMNPAPKRRKTVMVKAHKRGGRVGGQNHSNGTGPAIGNQSKAATEFEGMDRGTPAYRKGGMTKGKKTMMGKRMAHDRGEGAMAALKGAMTKMANSRERY